MAPYFSPEAIKDLEARHGEIQGQFRKLQERFIVRKYRSDRAREYAVQGFCRRLDILVRSIHFVFDLLPPEKEDIPDTDDVVASTMLIQFVINTAGCLDNLAWIWVCETGLQDENGRNLDRRQVGLGPSYWIVRNSLPKHFRKHLRRRRAWLRHLTEFRDSLAHRIPLYIPPYIISAHQAVQYAQFGADAIAAGQRGDFEAYDKFVAAQKQLGRFLPWMTHSSTEKSPQVVFHPQLLQDYATVDEFGRKMLEALTEFDKSSPQEKAPGPSKQLAFLTIAAALAFLAAGYLLTR
jgi:hypothetical protein